MRRAARTLIAIGAIAATAGALLVVEPAVAGADPVATATYSSSSTADLLSLTASLAGLNVAGAELGASSANATNAPAASSASAGNLRATVVGLAVPLQSVTQAAPPDHTTPATSGLDALNLPPLLGTNVLDASAQARTAPANSCLASGAAISTGGVSTAGVTVGSGVVPSLSGGVSVGDVADVGAISSKSTTSLVNLNASPTDVRAVESSATSTLSSLGLLGNAIKVSVTGPATLTADATGSAATSGVQYTAPTVVVTGPDNTPHTLTTSGGLTLPIDTRVLGTGLLASVTLSLGATQNVTNTGTAVSASVNVLNVNISLTAYVAGIQTATLVSTTLALGPMTVSANGPASGVQCLTSPPAPVIISPSAGATTSTTPPISGTGTPGDSISVTGPGAICGPVTVAVDGTWTCTPSSPLPVGSVTITATETNAAGSTPSDPVTFTVSAGAPTAPVITSPANGATVTDPTPLISGTGTTGDSVSVADSAETICGPVLVVAGGWSCVPLTALPEGQVTIVATQSNGSGSTPSTPVTINVVTHAPAAPIILTPLPGATLTDNTPTITGTGTGGDSISVTDSAGTVCGPVTVAVDDLWSCTASAALPDGPVTVTATETNAAGSTASAPRSFTIVSHAPLAPVILTPLPGATLTDNTPTITGTGTGGDSISVTDSAGTVCGPVTVAVDDTWSCTPTAGLPDGSVTVTATETNAAGSTDSAPRTFTIASSAPAAPVITSPTTGAVINNGTAAFTGTGTTGDTVTVSELGSALCSAVVAAGSWNCSPTTALSVGVHSVVATQRVTASSPVSPNSNIVVFTTTVVGTRYVAATPYRVLDTRAAEQHGTVTGPVKAGGSVTLSASQLRLTPGTATAVVLNLTVVAPEAAGWAVAYPSDQTRPYVSSLNFAKGRTRANLVIVPLAADGSVTVYVNAATQLVADVFGYFSNGLDVASGGLYHAVSPLRLLDTRSNDTPLGPGVVRALQVTGQDGIPSTGVASVIVNITVTRPTAAGNISAFPTRAPAQVTTSNLNFLPGDNDSNRAIVPVNSAGSISFSNSAGTTELVIDVVGYFSAPGSGDVTGAQFVSVDPTRMVDTRPPGINTQAAPLAAGASRAVQLAGKGAIPLAGTVAVLSNLTAVDSPKAGWLTEYETGTTRAYVSDVNYGSSDLVVPNLVIGAVDAYGDVSVYNDPAGAATNLIEDVSGYFSTALG